MRFLVDLPDEDIAELDALARHNGGSRAAEVREAVRLHLRSRKGNDWIGRGFGYWKGRDDLADIRGVEPSGAHPSKPGRAV